VWIKKNPHALRGIKNKKSGEYFKNLKVTSKALIPLKGALN
jgi:hypothetical protein